MDEQAELIREQGERLEALSRLEAQSATQAARIATQAARIASQADRIRVQEDQINKQADKMIHLNDLLDSS